VHEALATGLPVFVYDLGAQALAAAAAENGHLLPNGCEGAALERHLRVHGFGMRQNQDGRTEEPARHRTGPGRLAAGAGEEKV
jgi:hypothetical protein